MAMALTISSAVTASRPCGDAKTRHRFAAAATLSCVHAKAAAFSHSLLLLLLLLPFLTSSGTVAAYCLAAASHSAHHSASQQPGVESLPVKLSPSASAHTNPPVSHHIHAASFAHSSAVQSASLRRRQQRRGVSRLGVVPPLISPKGRRVTSGAGGESRNAPGNRRRRSLLREGAKALDTAGGAAAAAGSGNSGVASLALVEPHLAALLQLQQAWGAWAGNSNASTACSAWAGITCNPKGLVVALDTKAFPLDPPLSGAIPAFITNLATLQYLDLSYVNLEGTIPSLASLTRLTHLYVSFSHSLHPSPLPRYALSLHPFSLLSLHPFSLLSLHPFALLSLHPFSLLSLHPFSLLSLHPFSLLSLHPFSLLSLHPFSLLSLHPFSLLFLHPFSLLFLHMLSCSNRSPFPPSVCSLTLHAFFSLRYPHSLHALSLPSSFLTHSTRSLFPPLSSLTPLSPSVRPPPTTSGLVDLSLFTGDLSSLAVLSHLESLQDLTITGLTNATGEIPREIRYLTALTSLDLAYLRALDFPKRVTQISNLQYLDLAYLRALDFPKWVTQLSNLQYL
ncbi:unnamed protein product [Closterium sp. Naga37s-1]|nr:unnamed protein product [Closterium sp. Naga37s-1]